MLACIDHFSGFTPHNLPKATDTEFVKFLFRMDGDHIRLADEIIKAWGESEDQLVGSDCYADLAVGIQDYAMYYHSRKSVAN